MTSVATFEINYTQFLNGNGEVVQTLPKFANDPQILVKLYRLMVQTRAYDKKAIALQRTGKLGTYPSIYGQEAISTAIGYAMQPEDVLIPYYRDIAAQLQRGITMAEIYRYWGGDERGSNFKCGNKDFPMAIPIATQCLHATGIARALQLRQQQSVAVVTLGDGATSEGDFYEAINIAGVWQLPVVFIVNDNQWAISVPRSQQSHCQTLAQKAIAGGFSGEQVDGNDIIAVHHSISQALEKARTGGGPSLIEAISYRLHDHTTADDASRYQTTEQLAQAMQHEPIKRLHTYLTHIGAWCDDDEAALKQECAQQVEAAVAEFLNDEVQSLESIFDYQYAKIPKNLNEQRAQAMGKHNA